MVGHSVVGHCVVGHSVVGARCGGYAMVVNVPNRARTISLSYILVESFQFYVQIFGLWPKVVSEKQKQVANWLNFRIPRN